MTRRLADRKEATLHRKPPQRPGSTGKIRLNLGMGRPCLDHTRPFDSTVAVLATRMTLHTAASWCRA
jgi:hypothetical protein